MKNESILTEDSKVFEGSITTYIFPNEAGSITIKQNAGPFDEYDTLIIIPLSQVENMVKSLRRAKFEALQKE